MQDLIDFIEKETNKKVKIYDYSNQDLNKNQNLVTFNGCKFVIEFLDFMSTNKITGYYYIVYQNEYQLDNLKKVLSNLYKDITIFTHEDFLILNSIHKLNIHTSTPKIIESETYRKTCIVDLGFISNIDILNSRISSFKDILDSFLPDNIFFKSYLTLNDLTIYKSIICINKDNFFYNLLDYDALKSMDIKLLNTGLSFIENDLNISKTSSLLFLHRNTLIYRLDKIKEILSLDLRIFKDALVFYLISNLYLNLK